MSMTFPGRQGNGGQSAEIDVFRLYSPMMSGGAVVYIAHYR